MEALVYTGPASMAVRRVPDPMPRLGEHVVRTACCGVCGSDLHAYTGDDPRRPAPMVLGHEAAGTVQGGPRDGARVALNPLVVCGSCAPCRSGRDNLCTRREVLYLPPRAGAFASHVALPDDNLVPVPDGVLMATAALCEPMAYAWHAVRIGLGAGSGGLDVRRMTLHEIAVVGSYTFTARDFRDCAAALFAGRLGPLDWTERRALADGPRASVDLHAGRVAAPKIILDMS